MYNKTAKRRSTKFKICKPEIVYCRITWYRIHYSFKTKINYAQNCRLKKRWWALDKVKNNNNR